MSLLDSAPVRCLCVAAACAFLLATAGCAGQDSTSGHNDNPDPHEQPAGDPVVSVPENDPRMLAAATEARRRWPEFVHALDGRLPGQVFLVKHGVRTSPTDIEHLWVQVDSVSGLTVAGHLNSPPSAASGLAPGAALSFDASEISDWCIYQHRRLISGGFQIAVLEQIQKEQPAR